MKGMTEGDMSVLSGRISNPNIPPKSKAEAKEHLKQIERLKLYERQLMEKEAQTQRRRRDVLQFTTREWESILPSFSTERDSKRTLHAWRDYALPPCYRGEVWKRVLGNPGEVTETAYRLLLGKAEERKRFAHQRQEDRDGTPNGNSPMGTAPFDETMRRLMEEDPNYFSPKHGKDDTAQLIGVDLHRTIITKSYADPSHSRASSFGSTPTSPMQGFGSQTLSQNGELPEAPGGSGSAASATLSTSSYSTPKLSRTQNHNDNSDGMSNSTATSGEGEHEHVNPAETTATMLSNQSFTTTTLVEAMGNDGSLLTRLEMCLRCFVEYRPDMGYVQGMSYLAAMLLMNLDDRDAFIALSVLLTKGHFPYFYTVNHQGMSAHISVFDSVVRLGNPELARNLTVVGVAAQMYVIDWWMSLWSRTLPYDIAARCWDLYFLDDAYLYRISFCLLTYFSYVIHEDAALDEVMSFLSKIQSQPIDEERFFNLVLDPKVGPSIADIHKIMNEQLQILG